jgi:hypothetical protein
MAASNPIYNVPLLLFWPNKWASTCFWPLLTLLSGTNQDLLYLLPAFFAAGTTTKKLRYGKEKLGNKDPHLPLPPIQVGNLPYMGNSIDNSL